MKDNNNTNNNLLNSTTNHLKSFIEGLKEVSNELSESEFEQYLKADVMPELLKGETVYGDSIFNKMDVVKIVQIDSTLEYRGLSIEDAIRRMNVKAICWMIDHLASMKGLILEAQGTIPMKEPHYIERLNGDYVELQEWINEDIYERLQEYQSEIKNGNNNA